jgi:hypothetical protein
VMTAAWRASVVSHKYLYTTKLSFSESVNFLFLLGVHFRSLSLPLQIPLPVQGEGKRALARAGEGSIHITADARRMTSHEPAK